MSMPALSAERFARQLLGAAAVAVIQTRVGFHVRQQLGQRAHGKIGMDQQQVGDLHGERDRLEVLQRVVSDRAEEMRIDRERPGIAHQQRVAIGRRLGHEGRADTAAGAGLVLDDEGLPERGAQPLGDRARIEVGAAAGRERHHDGDRSRRIGIRPLRRCRDRPRKAQKAGGTGKCRAI